MDNMKTDKVLEAYKEGRLMWLAYFENIDKLTDEERKTFCAFMKSQGTYRLVTE